MNSLHLVNLTEFPKRLSEKRLLLRSAANSDDCVVNPKTPSTQATSEPTAVLALSSPLKVRDLRLILKIFARSRYDAILGQPPIADSETEMYRMAIVLEMLKTLGLMWGFLRQIF